MVADPAQRGLLVTIHHESLVPRSSIPASSSFAADLAHVGPALEPTTPLYVLLRRDESAPDGFVAVTYVPDAAPVRQKTLFAATRHTLVRALGAERFRHTRFVTEPSELEPDGWERHERGEAAEGPLTEEEKVLRGVREEEEAGKNTTDRRALVGGRVPIGISAEARNVLGGWGREEGDNLVQLVGCPSGRFGPPVASFQVAAGFVNPPSNTTRPPPFPRGGPPLSPFLPSTHNTRPHTLLMMQTAANRHPIGNRRTRPDQLDLGQRLSDQHLRHRASLLVFSLHASGSADILLLFFLLGTCLHLYMPA